MSEWKPILTAPDDGTCILLTGGYVDTVWYDQDAFKPECVVAWWEEPNPDLVGQWRFCSFDGGTYGEYEYPTHWMPLPEPPK